MVRSSSFYQPSGFPVFQKRRQVRGLARPDLNFPTRQLLFEVATDRGCQARNYQPAMRHFFRYARFFDERRDRVGTFSLCGEGECRRSRGSADGGLGAVSGQLCPGCQPEYCRRRGIERRSEEGGLA